MMSNQKEKARYARKKRVRKKVHGTPERPRLSVFRSEKHIYAQLVNDVEAHTVVAASTLSPEIRKGLKSTSDVEAAKKVGELIARKAAEKGIESVVFDRNGYRYHGRVKAVAEAAREGGLKF